MSTKPSTVLTIRVSNLIRAWSVRFLPLIITLNTFWTATVHAGKPAPPAAPSNLSATAASTSQIDLAWQDSSPNESGFIIQRAMSANGPWTQIATVGKSVTSYSSTSLSGSTTYYYRVCSYNSRGNSSYSNTADATTLGCSYSLSPASASSSSAGGNSSVSVSAGASCNWNATSTVSWITTGSSGSGNGMATYSV